MHLFLKFPLISLRSTKKKFIQILSFYYLNLFNWIFFIPYLNISFFIIQKNVNNSLIIFFSVLNLIIIIFLSFICLFLNYNRFLTIKTENLMLNYSRGNFIFKPLEIIIVFIYNYQFKNSYLILPFYYIWFIMIITTFFLKLPFRNKKLNAFYIKMMFITQGTAFLKTFQNFHYKIHIFIWFLQILILMFFVEVFFEKFYSNFYLIPLDFSSNFKNFSFIIEETYLNALNSDSNRSCLINFTSILENHKKNCTINCICRNLIFNNFYFFEKLDNTTINRKKVQLKSLKITNLFQVIDKKSFKKKKTLIETVTENEDILKEKNWLINLKQIFEFIDRYLETKLKIESKSEITLEYEILLIKYINYLIYVQKNYIKAIYFLSSKIFLHKRDFSLRFRICEKNLKRNIFEKLLKKKISFQKENKFEYSKNNEQFSFINFFKSEEIKDKMRVKTFNICKSIEVFWRKVENGYKTVEKFYEDVLIVMKKIIKMKKVFKSVFEKYQKNINLLKLHSIFYSFALNDPITSLLFERKFIELIKKDEYSDKTVINNMTIAENKVSSIIVSYLQKWGKIIKYSNNCPSLFGYIH